MLPLPSIQIRQTYAKLGMDMQPDHLEIKQPRASMEMDITPPKLTLQSPRGLLQIDSSRAWEALIGGTYSVFSDRLNDGLRTLFLQAIGRKVEEGNRMAEIHTGRNAIADLAYESFFLSEPVEYLGPAAFDNVDIHYTAQNVVIDAENAVVSIETTPNKPEIEYKKGYLNIYMLHYGSITITPPQIDLSV